MAEQMNTRKVRRRRVDVSRDATKTAQELLETTVNKAIDIQNKISELQEELDSLAVVATPLMEQLKLSRYTTDKAEAIYDHPPQKTTTTYDTVGLFEAVSPEDFIASVKVQKGLAEKVIDPKVLKKYSTSAKSPLKPKTLKIKSLKK